MELMNNPKRIVCVVPETKALPLATGLHKEKQIDSANIHRGRGRSTQIRAEQTFGEYTEMEVVTVLVDGNRAEEIFEYLYYEMGLDKTRGGFLYQVPAVKSTRYQLPDVPEEEGAEQ